MNAIATTTDGMQDLYWGNDLSLYVDHAPADISEPDETPKGTAYTLRKIFGAVDRLEDSDDVPANWYTLINEVSDSDEALELLAQPGTQTLVERYMTAVNAWS